MIGLINPLYFIRKYRYTNEVSVYNLYLFRMVYLSGGAAWRRGPCGRKPGRGPEKREVPE